MASDGHAHRRGRFGQRFFIGADFKHCIGEVVVELRTPLEKRGRCVIDDPRGAKKKGSPAEAGEPSISGRGERI
jgi:hypothetical protein